MLRPALSLATVGTLVTAAMAGFAAGAARPLAHEGLLLGSILSSTDGAAIFAVLRGSSLQKRLSRTLEGESGFNDPVAVLLVLGFIDWIQEPDYGLVDMLWLFARQLGIGRSWDSGSGGLPFRPSSARARHARPLPGGVAGLRRTRLRRGGLDRGLGLPRRLPRRPRAGQRQHPREADDYDLPPALPGWRSSPCSWRSAS